MSITQFDKSPKKLVKSPKKLVKSPKKLVKSPKKLDYSPDKPLCEQAFCTPPKIAKIVKLGKVLAKV